MHDIKFGEEQIQLIEALQDQLDQFVYLKIIRCHSLYILLSHTEQKKRSSSEEIMIK